MHNNTCINNHEFSKSLMLDVFAKIVGHHKLFQNTKSKFSSCLVSNPAQNSEVRDVGTTSNSIHFSSVLMYIEYLICSTLNEKALHRSKERIAERGQKLTNFQLEKWS